MKEIEFISYLDKEYLNRLRVRLITENGDFIRYTVSIRNILKRGMGVSCKIRLRSWFFPQRDIVPQWG